MYSSIKSLSFPLLKCLCLVDADYVLREIHEGIYINHIEGRSLTYKALRRIYWLTMKEDAMELDRKCNQCQHYANIQR